MVFVIIVIVICLTVYGIIISKHNTETDKIFWSGSTEPLEVDKLKMKVNSLEKRLNKIEKEIFIIN